MKPMLPMLLAFVAAGAQSCAGAGYAPGPEGWWHSKGERPHFFAQPEQAFKVIEERPRIYLRKTDLPWLRERAAGTFKPCMDAMLKIADEEIRKPGDNEPKNWSYGREKVAALALLTGEKKYEEWCVNWGKLLAGSKPGGEEYLRFRLMVLAVLYDWFHDKYSAQERKAMCQGIVNQLEALRNYYPFLKGVGRGDYVGGHARKATLSAAMAVAAIWHDHKDEALLNPIRKCLMELYSCDAWVTRGGGFYMGWGNYTQGYTDIEAYTAWTTATNDVLLDDWMGELAYWNIYGLRGDDHFPAMEDSAPELELMVARSFAELYGTGILKDPYARWFYVDRGYERGLKDWGWFWRMIYWDDAVPSRKPDALPHARVFPGAGTLIARDRWDDKATHFVFRSLPFNAGNHRDADSNSFVIHYRGELAIDSGGSYFVGTNEYKRAAVAHNVVTVLEPNGKNPNPGGGQSLAKTSASLSDIQPGGACYVQGLMRSELGAGYAFAAGDATKCYRAETVKLYQREVVFIEKSAWSHPLIVVCDRIETTRPEIEKRFLLHTVDKPAVEGALVTAMHKAGKLFCRTVWPRAPKIDLIGGPGKTGWVHELKRDFGPRGPEKAKGGEAPMVQGAWRAEVMPDSPNTRDYFLHVFYVTDADDSVPAPVARAIDSPDALGVQTCGWTVVFPKSESGVTGVSFAAPEGAAGPTQVFVASLPAEQKLNFKAGQATGEVTTGSGGCALFSADLVPGDLVKLEPGR